MQIVVILCLALFGAVLFLWISRAGMINRLQNLKLQLHGKTTEIDILERDHLGFRANVDDIMKLSQVAHIFHQLPKTLSSSYNFPFVWIDLADTSGEKFELAGGYNAVAGRTGDPLKQGFEFTKYVIASGKAQLLRGQNTGQDLLRTKLPAQITTSLSMPLSTGKHCWGVLHMADDREHPLSRTKLDDLKLLANLLSLAVDHLRAEEQLRSKESERRAMGSLVSDAVVTMNAKGIITSVNTAFEDMLGYRSREAIGQNVSLIIPKDGPQLTAHLERYLHTGEQQVLGLTREVSGLHKNGMQIAVDLTVQESKQDGRQSFTGLIHDISERKEHEQKLEQARLAALGAEQARQRFLGNMNHALRTPLSCVVGMADLLQEADLHEEQREYVQTLLVSSQTLVENLDGLVACAHLEDGLSHQEPEPLNLRTILDELGDALSAQICDTPIDLFVAVDPAIPTPILGDSVRLRQVLLHLAYHVAKEAEAGPLVLGVTLVALNGAQITLDFWIKDKTGGLDVRTLSILGHSPKEILAAPSGAEGSFDLHLAGQLGTLLGGHFKIDTSDEGTITVNYRLTLVCPKESSCFTSKQLSQVRCLILEPDPTALNALQSLLYSYGCKPQHSRNGPETLQVLRSSAAVNQPYDLLIFPYSIKGVPTDGLVKSLRSDQSLATTHLLMHSALSQRGPALEIMSEDGNACLTRPVKQKRLVETILNLLKDNKALVPQVLSAESLITSFMNQIVVLVVEGSEKQMSKMLENNNVSYYLACNSQDAVHAYQRDHFDVVVIDLNLTGLNGLEVTKQLRTIEGPTRHAPILAMAAGLNIDQQNYIDQGVDHLIDKPIQASELIALIKRVLEPTD